MLLTFGFLVITINQLFFVKMEFIQSQVYPNLYLVKHLEKDQGLVHQAIKQKIAEHLKTEYKTGKPLAYKTENGIYFYELGGFTLGFIAEAGTGYFIDQEEDLGGFVSEELGMYTEYRLAEFYYENCQTDSALYCGNIDYFEQGEFVKTETMLNLKGYHKTKQ